MSEAPATKILLPYAIGVLLLGAVGFAFGDFARQWQPVPEALPYRMMLAYINAQLLVAGGFALLARRIAATAALLVGCYFALWAIVLHLPPVIMEPDVPSRWNGLAEITALAMGGMTGWALLRAAGEHAAVLTIAQRVFGACLAVFGLCHFVYADFTAAMVPAWLPAPLLWAYATGGGHLLASLSLLTGVRTLLASSLLTAMFACFVVLLHIPRVFGDPGNHTEWLMLAVSLSLTGAAWIIRASVVATAAHPRMPSTQPAEATEAVAATAPDCRSNSRR
jgi:uncharacterized membrane protein